MKGEPNYEKNKDVLSAFRRRTMTVHGATYSPGYVRLLALHSSVAFSGRIFRGSTKQPVSCSYNVLEYASKTNEMYTRRYGGRSAGRVLLVGMNPGPWGMVSLAVTLRSFHVDQYIVRAVVGTAHVLGLLCHPFDHYVLRRNIRRAVLLTMMLAQLNPSSTQVQTGVPFGEISYVRDWLKVEGEVGRPGKEHPKRPVEGFDCKRSEVRATPDTEHAYTPPSPPPLSLYSAKL